MSNNIRSVALEAATAMTKLQESWQAKVCLLYRVQADIIQKQERVWDFVPDLF